MDAKLVNRFVKAAVNVIDTMASVKVVPHEPYLKKDKIAIGYVSGVVGITGEANGTFSITFDEVSIITIVSNMFGEDINEVNNDVLDAVGELSNIISGHARRDLAEMNRIFEGGVPTVVSGENHKITHITDGPIIAVPCIAGEGKFLLELCFEK